MRLRYLMTANPTQPGALRQLRHTELTGNYCVTLLRNGRQRRRSASRRCMEQLSAISRDVSGPRSVSASRRAKEKPGLQNADNPFNAHSSG